MYSFNHSYMRIRSSNMHIYILTVGTYNYTAEASNLTNNPRGYNHILYKKLSPQILERFMHSNRYTRNYQTNKKSGCRLAIESQRVRGFFMMIMHDFLLSRYFSGSFMYIHTAPTYLSFWVMKALLSSHERKHGMACRLVPFSFAW